MPSFQGLFFPLVMVSLGFLDRRCFPSPVFDGADIALEQQLQPWLAAPKALRTMCHIRCVSTLLNFTAIINYLHDPFDSPCQRPLIHHRWLGCNRKYCFIFFVCLCFIVFYVEYLFMIETYTVMCLWKYHLSSQTLCLLPGMWIAFGGVLKIKSW